VSAPTGRGPGHITADGCAVDLYAAMQPGTEPDVISSAIPVGSSILELGAGAGRVTRELVSRGFEVVAVDDSSEMLAHIVGAETVVASIEGLDLQRRFDAVLLCSHLINTVDREQREQFVATCARHVHPTGALVIERHTPDWFDTARDGTVTQDGIEIRLHQISRPGVGLLSATVDYRMSDRRWTQSFVAERVDDGVLGALLDRHGLAVDRFLDEAGTWVLATPARSRLV
jgi:SAM-dependent methyltransferase